MKLSHFNFELPEELLAEYPATNRDESRLMVLNRKDKTIEDVLEASDQLHLKALSKPVTKYYICFPKQLV